MNKNDKDSHLDAFGKLFSNELSQKEMVSIERSPTSANPENNREGSFLQASEVKQLPLAMIVSTSAQMSIFLLLLWCPE